MVSTLIILIGFLAVTLLIVPTGEALAGPLSPLTRDLIKATIRRPRAYYSGFL